MTNNLTAVETQDIYQLWQKLTLELDDIYDAHGVCAAVAYKLALHTACTTVVGLRDPQHTYYDIWICNNAGEVKQDRWNEDKTSFAPLVNEQRPLLTEKFSRPPSELVNSELWRIPEDRILSVPIPFPKQHPLSLTPPGIICLLDPDERCYLTTENIRSVASQITTYLDRAYLRLQVDRQDIEFTVVSEISYELTSQLSFQNIFHQLSNNVRRTLNVESVSMGLIEDATGDILFVDVLMGPIFQDLPPVRLSKGEGIAGWVAEQREPVIINDVYTDRRFYSQVDHLSGFETRSMICIPILVEDRVIGILQAINKQNGQFNNNDLRLLQALGGPLGAAIQNARLHDDVIAEKRRIETIFASMSEGLMTVTAEGLITQANDSIHALLAWREGSVLGRNFHDIIQTQKPDELRAFTQQVLQAEDEYPQWAVEIRQADKEYVPVLISGAPIKGDSGKTTEIIFVFSDLRQIREVERMRDDFFHGIIHELRTPLATILMYARLLREGKATNKEKEDRFLGVIERESDRLQKMVRQMLELAKLESGEFQRSFETVSINEIFERMLPTIADRATEKGLMFRQKIESDLPLVRGNKDTFELVFRNLLENALKFTLSGMIQVKAWVDDAQVCIQVKDEGIGIPTEAMPNLFRRFYRAQTAVERGIAGSGLGLYMVRESVQTYDGSIHVESQVDKGTTFLVSFPTLES